MLLVNYLIIFRGVCFMYKIKLCFRVTTFVMAFLLLTGCTQYSSTGNESIDSMSVTELGIAFARALDEQRMTHDELEDAYLEIDRLWDLVHGVQFEDPLFPAIKRLNDATEREVFAKPTDFLPLLEPIVYVGSETIAVNNRLAFGGIAGITLGIFPSWSFRMDGNKLYMSTIPGIDPGIYGIITVGRFRGELNMEYVDIVFDGHEGREEVRDESDPERIMVPGIKPTRGIVNWVPMDPGRPNLPRGEVTMNRTVIGRVARLHTSVEGHSGMLHVYVFGYESCIVLAAFAYETAYNDTSEALLLTLLTSIAFADNSRTIAVNYGA
jgi:hypothetical protein